MAKTVELSSTQAEAGSIVECVMDIIFFRGVLNELHMEQLEPTPLYNDNKSTITLATRYSGVNKRVRYMLMRVNWLMEKSKEQIYNLVWLASEQLPSDFGPKRQTGAEFERQSARVMGT